MQKSFDQIKTVSGISFSDHMAASLVGQMSTTDVLSLNLLAAINLISVFSSPFMASKFSKVFTDFFEKTAETGRKVTSNGLINETCSKLISKRTIWKVVFIYVLVGLTVLFNISFVYLFQKELGMIQDIDYAITYHLLFISIPSIFVFTYPQSIGAIEFAIVFSTEFLAMAYKKWKEDFKKDFDEVRSQLAQKGNNKTPANLRNSKQP